MPKSSLTFEIEVDPTKMEAGINRVKGKLKELPAESRRGLQSIASQATQTGRRNGLWSDPAHLGIWGIGRQDLS